jgi:large repetitive protein
MRDTQGSWILRMHLLSALLLLSIGTASAAVDKVICVPWQGDVVKQHTALNGVAVQLKGVIKTSDTSPVYYKWVFGDGSADSTPILLSGDTKYSVDTTHAYTAASGTPFTALLQVSNSLPFSLTLQDTYLVKLEDDSQDARINLAIDMGLWWLYKQGNTHGYTGYGRTYDGSPPMTWLQTSSLYTLVTPTASAVHAFGINGHKMKGNPDQDPYVEAVQMGMNYLVKGYNYYTSYPALRAYTIPVSGNHPADDPDTNHNGYGIQVYDYGGGDVPYQNGQIMDAIVASGVAPSDLTGRDFTHEDAVATHNWTYGELLQDMSDMQAWGQNDNGTCNGGICGSWWYGWNYGSPGDNSASQWSAIGMLAAQQAPWNVIVPQWVKNLNANWLEYSHFIYNGNPDHVAFSYNSVGGCAGDACQQTTTSGMVQMIFAGQSTADTKWVKAQKYLADNWQNFTHGGSNWGGNKTYGWYSFAKAMRLSLPVQTTHLVKTSGADFDWYYGNPNNAACGSEATCEKGLAMRIVETQAADGSWQNGNLTNPPLTTAWMIITLKPTLFEASPIACFAASPNPSYANQNIAFDPACSGHSEAGKSIANLTKFEWDWDNNGTYDTATAGPDVQAHAYSCAVLPCSYPVKLRVTDDSNPQRSATAIVNINITNPPHPPVAKPGGPYLASTCASDSLKLDGSASFDQDQGTHEAGCATCPNDTITAWDWDLRAPLTFDVIDFTGSKPTLSAGNITSFLSPGVQNIGLRVTDNTRLAYPGSGQPNLSNASFASVNLGTGCLCSLSARAKTGMVQLGWAAAEHTASTLYTVLRSTAGPNTGFTTIRTGYSNALPLYVDSGLTNGTTYYYRVEKALATGATCRSTSVSGTPSALTR